MSSVRHILDGYNPYNVNDNASFINKTNNDNDIDRRNVDRIADRLVEKFGSPQSREFYCKVAWKLSEAQIWSNYEKSLRGKSPAALFNWLCRKDFRD